MKYFCLFLFVFLLISCKNNPAQTTDQMEMTLKAAPATTGAGDSVTITAEVVNTGATDCQHAEGCSFWAHGMQITFFDPGNNQVYLWDPRYRRLCPDYFVAFAPGEKLTGVIHFNGKLFDSSGVQSDAAAGTYTARVSFTPMHGTPVQEDSVVERSVSFQWIAR